VVVLVWHALSNAYQEGNFHNQPEDMHMLYCVVLSQKTITGVVLLRLVKKIYDVNRGGKWIWRKPP